MPVQTIPAGPREAARFIVCDKRSDINRVALTRAHMDQWKCDAEALARFVVEQVGLRRSRHRADASGTQPLGLAAALVHNSRSRSIIALHPEIRGPA